MQKNPSVMSNLHNIGDRIAESTGTPGRKNSGGFVASPEQMERRYEEYLRARRDLEERVESLVSKYSEEERQCSDRILKLQNAQTELTAILNAVPEPEEGKIMFHDRAEAAAAMRNVEKRRIEAMRVISATEQDQNSPDKNNRSTENTIMLLESLSFQQIFRVAFAAALPFLFWSLLGALIVSFAIVGALKGWF